MSDDVVFLVSTDYAADEVEGVYRTREAAEAKAAELDGMWTVEQWTVRP